MDIGIQIKKRRQELGMTQEMLAKQLNVGRTTVSNWEIGRNYPDLQLIVAISNILDLPLEVLLGKESEIVKEITNDTNIRKLQSRRIKILSTLLMVVILIVGFVFYKVFEYQDIYSPEQIVSIRPYESNLEIITDLPFYRSVVGYSIGNNSGDKNTIEFSLTTQIDLSLEHQQKILVNLDEVTTDMKISNIKKVNIINENEIVKTFAF